MIWLALGCLLVASAANFDDPPTFWRLIAFTAVVALAEIAEQLYQLRKKRGRR